MAIRYRLAVGFGLLFTLMLAVLWLTLKLQLEQTLSQQTRTLGQILAKQTADSVTELVLANDLLGLNVVLGQLAREPGVHSVTVTDVDGLVLATTSPAAPSPAGTDSYQAPITLQDAVAGRVTLVLDGELLSNPLARPHTIFYASIGLTLLLVVILSLVLGAQVTRQVRSLIELSDNPAAADEGSFKLLQDDEFGVLQDRLLGLLQRLQALEQQIELTALPDPDDLDKLNLRAERRMSSLLLVEVANIHTAVELLHPATLSTLLQEYQFYLRQAARLYRGVLTRIEGHKVLVSFDARRCQDDHAFNAVCCGQLFLRLMQQTAQTHRAYNAQSLDFNLVMHSGDAYYSPLWKKKKAEGDTTREETIIGKAVDLTYAMLPAATVGHLLASELSLELAGGQKYFDQPQGREVNVGPDNLTLMTYILAAGNGTHAELLERQTRHLLPDTKPADSPA